MFSNENMTYRDVIKYPLIHKCKYSLVSEIPMFPIIDGWQTFKVTSECTICKRIIETYVKKIGKIQ